LARRFHKGPQLPPEGRKGVYLSLGWAATQGVLAKKSIPRAVVLHRLSLATVSLLGKAGQERIAIVLVFYFVATCVSDKQLHMMY
jgi:hypothetical protein